MHSCRKTESDSCVQFCQRTHFTYVLLKLLTLITGRYLVFTSLLFYNSWQLYHCSYRVSSGSIVSDYGLAVFHIVLRSPFFAECFVLKDCVLPQSKRRVSIP
jgi:hypothetical protein